MNLLKKVLVRELQKRGYSAYFAPIVLHKRLFDLLRNKQTTWKQKIWAQRRGFLSDKIAFYGLTEDNYKYYLSDFDYWKLHPINGYFSKWIDDKLTTKMILQPFNDYLPEYYYLFSLGEIIKLSECPHHYENNIDSVLNLLQGKTELAAKPFGGSSGEGFYYLAYNNGTFSINRNVVDQETVIELLNQWGKSSEQNYLITEYLKPHKDLSKIYAHTSNTLRVTVIRDKLSPPRLLSALIRFGTNQTGVVDNALAGGVFSKVDLITGEFSNGRIVTDGVLQNCPKHPNTQEDIKGIIPFWDLICIKILEICEYLYPLKMLGIDIIVTEAGLKIIEINSHPNIEFIQYDVPAYQNELSAKFFLNLNLNN